MAAKAAYTRAGLDHRLASNSFLNRFYRAGLNAQQAVCADLGDNHWFHPYKLTQDFY
jgi:hypothetical protein